MGKLDKYLGSVPGYFRTNEEDKFPWDLSGGAIWFALLVFENGKICRYGFTSAKSSKQNLCEALKKLEPKDEAVLLGIWTGRHRTDLFVLNIEKAIVTLETQ